MALEQSNVVLFAINQRKGDAVRVQALSLTDGKVTTVGTDAYAVVGVARGYLVYLNRTATSLRRPSMHAPTPSPAPASGWAAA